MLFSIFAGVLLGFSVAALWLAGNPDAWQALIDAVTRVGDRLRVFVYLNHVAVDSNRLRRFFLPFPDCANVSSQIRSTGLATKTDE